MRSGSMTAQLWIVAGMTGVGLALAGADTPLRTLLALTFLVAAPTMAVAGLLRGLDTYGRIFVAFIATAAIDTLVGVVMLEAGVWSPDAAFVVVVVITALIGAAQLPPVRRRASRYAPTLRAAVRRLERL